MRAGICSIARSFGLPCSTRFTGCQFIPCISFQVQPFHGGFCCADGLIPVRLPAIAWNTAGIHITAQTVGGLEKCPASWRRVRGPSVSLSCDQLLIMASKPSWGLIKICCRMILQGNQAKTAERRGGFYIALVVWDAKRAVGWFLAMMTRVMGFNERGASGPDYRCRKKKNKLGESRNF